MKIRTDFVSNSSSSSFLIGIPSSYLKEIKKKGAEAVKKYFFKDVEELKYYDHVISTDQASEILFEEIKNAKIAKQEEILDLIYNSYMIGDYIDPELKNRHFNNKLTDVEKDEMENKENEERNRLSKIFWKNHTKYDYENTKYIIIEFSDNQSEEECVLEHGPTFDNCCCTIKTLRFSHH
ncbi:hypothetical protein M0R19_08470 [Candidatus Pacearchaeota archaeon]|jgi:hypothetical protein|nr:hypothetical protein [bacterium]MCK9597191.1 hypothetical protein [Candidatus Pacearchaeota archaeon]